MSAPIDIIQKVVPIAARWMELHPELANRIEKAVFLVPQVETTASPGVFRVKGDTGEYLVQVWPDKHRSTCTCPDSQKGNHCKHRLAVALKIMMDRG